MRNRYIGLLVFLGVMLLLLLIWLPRKEKVRPVRPPQSAPVHGITYSVEVFHEKAGLPGPGDENRTFERTVYFDGIRSCTREPQDGCGVYYTLRDTSSAETLVMEFPWLTVFYRQPAGDSGSLIRGTLHTAAETKIILGYRCRKAVATGEGTTQTIWFAPELRPEDPTGAVVQDSRVPGLILGLDTRYGPQMGNYHVRYTVTGRASSSDRSVFKVPRQALQATDGEEAIALVAERLAELQVAASLPDDDKDRFLGKWQLVNNGQRVEWHVERFGAATYTLSETRTTGGKRRPVNRGILSFYEGKLVVREGAVFRLFALTAGDRLQETDDPRFTFRRLK
jgi:hypothetical protein